MSIACAHIVLPFVDINEKQRRFKVINIVGKREIHFKAWYDINDMPGMIRATFTQSCNQGVTLTSSLESSTVQWHAWFTLRDVLGCFQNTGIASPANSFFGGFNNVRMPPKCEIYPRKVIFLCFNSKQGGANIALIISSHYVGLPGVIIGCYYVIMGTALPDLCLVREATERGGSEENSLCLNCTKCTKCAKCTQCTTCTKCTKCTKCT